MIIKDGLTFDDVLLVPQYSNINSRSEVDIFVQLEGLEFNHPIIPANMKTITGRDMAVEIIRSGGLAILHRFMSEMEQFEIAKDILDMFGANHFAISIGIKKEDHPFIHRFIEQGVKIFCIDVAHGDSEQCLDTIKWLKYISPGLFVIAGNVATGQGAMRLWEAGANMVKVGIGPGSLCTTRIETGNGVPQLTALMDVAKVRQELTDSWKKKDTEFATRQFSIIADGGIKNAGDIVKALCFADMVMIGNLFSGADETPGQVMSIDGHSYKQYIGSSTHKTNHIEGVAAIVPTKGSYESILSKLLEGLRSGCSYQGAHFLKELKDNPEFIRITNAGLRESHAHDVKIV